MKYILKFKEYLLIIDCSEKNIHIKDSYQITDKKDMKRILSYIFNKSDYQYKRSMKSLINEWAAHNWLYYHNIKTERTKDVDLNENENFLRKLGYFIISKLFCK